MYTGTLIKDLMATVEQAKEARCRSRSPTNWNCNGSLSCRFYKCRMSRFS